MYLTHGISVGRLYFTCRPTFCEVEVKISPRNMTRQNEIVMRRTRVLYLLYIGLARFSVFDGRTPRLRKCPESSDPMLTKVGLQQRGYLFYFLLSKTKKKLVLASGIFSHRREERF